MQLETNGAALLIRRVRSSSAEPAERVVAEPKYTCAHPPYGHRYPAIGG